MDGQLITANAENIASNFLFFCQNRKFWRLLLHLLELTSVTDHSILAFNSHKLLFLIISFSLGQLIRLHVTRVPVTACIRYQCLIGVSLIICFNYEIMTFFFPSVTSRNREGASGTRLQAPSCRQPWLAVELFGALGKGWRKAVPSEGWLLQDATVWEGASYKEIKTDQTEYVNYSYL